MKDVTYQTLGRNRPTVIVRTRLLRAGWIVVPCVNGWRKSVPIIRKFVVAEKFRGRR